VLGKFKTYITEYKLCSLSDRILIAVSGGIDSVVLLDLFIKAGYFCGIAHCNFNLRGAESDEDEMFVKDLANHFEVPVFTKSFETTEYAEINKLSIQMAARELRYEWFEDIRQEQGFDLIATAHNKDDILETFLLNLMRGTGIHGLTGIRNKTLSIIRPLLFGTRQEITDYAISNSITWREDSSNSSLKYSRNKIRHQLLPLFGEIAPKFTSTMIENIQRLSDAEEIYSQYVQQKKENLLVRESGFLSISIESLKSLYPLETWLYEILKDFNYTSPVISDIIYNLDRPPGGQFFSGTHRITKDRDKLIIEPKKGFSIKKYYIEDPYREINEPIQLEMDVLAKSESFILSGDASTAFLDLDLLDFPLIIRNGNMVIISNL
jgi:tRNA(Ile)-lysidine synthase